MDPVKLSKTLAHALRHAPQDYNLALDDQGWADAHALITTLRARRAFATLSLEALAHFVDHQQDKRRFELVDGRIRACYAHSIPTPIAREPATPPDLLYHGTPPRAVEAILREGLKPMSRQHVHMSDDVKTALVVGSRRAQTPTLLVIDASAAHRAGVTFYHGNDETWLADAVPPAFIRVNEALK